MKGKIFSISLWVAFLGIDILIAAVICEGWVRHFIPTTNICYTTDAQIGVRFCPNQRRYGYVEKGYSNVFTTNSQGFHDLERALTKDKNTYRIQIYGDSMVQGKALQIKDTIPGIVESYLNKQGFQQKIEVLNMASGDDSTSNQLQTYEVIGRSYNPDLVICYFVDDFSDNVFKIHNRVFSPYHKIGENGEIVYVPPIPKDHSTLWEKFKATSQFYRLCANKLFESKFYNDFNLFLKNVVFFVTPKDKKADEKQANSVTEARRQICINESWPLTLKLLKHFKERVEKNGSRFILVDGAPFSENSVGTKYSNKDLLNYCRQNNIEYLSVYEKLAEIRNYENRAKYFFKDNHPTPLANRKMSLYFAKKLKDHIKLN
jgi:hypothetical protein